jgi:hypothetical protein
VIVLSGCCRLPVSSKEALRTRYPEFASKATDLYEVSLDFWEQMDKAAYYDESNFVIIHNKLGFGDSEDGRRRLSEQMKLVEQRHAYSSKVFLEIRKRMETNGTVLFHYAHRDPGNPSQSNQGILFFRNGKIQDKLVLDGSGAWKPME